jgi:hypothetical protein
LRGRANALSSLRHCRSPPTDVRPASSRCPDGDVLYVPDHSPTIRSDAPRGEFCASASARQAVECPIIWIPSDRSKGASAFATPSVLSVAPNPRLRDAERLSPSASRKTEGNSDERSRPRHCIF